MSSEFQREPKRARQACLNCRRKKTRCQGERPVCGLCMRLGQNCEYPSTFNSLPATINQRQAALADADANDLTARVAKLEAELRSAKHAQIPNNEAPDMFNTAMPDLWPACNILPTPLQLYHSQDQTQNQPLSAPQWQDMSRASFSTGTTRFSELPPQPILDSLVDVYFEYCHNQPYCFFHESSLRRRVAADEIPQYLLLALSATAARYSSHEYFKGCQMEAVEALSRAAWVIILDQVFATNQESELTAAQATCMLAVIDFTAGHHRLGWVKIGLAIRLVQGLRLNTEPDASLPTWEQEERRRVFWSVYLLDKFVSCGRSRPPAILDVDCTVSLPCSEEKFIMEAPTDMLNLNLIREIPGNMSVVKALDSFSTLVLMCSALGMTIRDIFQQDPAKIPCWDCRSNFAKISSLMMSFEAIHTAGSDQLDLYIADRFGAYEGYDRQRVGHFVWARGVYHLYGCLLYHPVSLYASRQAHGADFPVSFAQETLDRCTRHARYLTNILQTVLTTGCCARGSFLGYMATCAASIHQIYTHSPDPTISAKAKVSLDTCLSFLERQPVRWVNYTMMATAVREFTVDPTLARALINPLHIVTDPDADLPQLNLIWNVIDYGLLTEIEGKKQPTGLSPFSASPDQAMGAWPVS